MSAAVERFVLEPRLLLPRPQIPAPPGRSPDLPKSIAGTEALPQVLRAETSQQRVLRDYTPSELERHNHTYPAEETEVSGAARPPQLVGDVQQIHLSFDADQELQTLLTQLQSEQNQLQSQVQQLCLKERERITSNTGTRDFQLDSSASEVYRQEAETMKSTLRSRKSTSPIRQAAVKGGTYDSELIRILRERDELQSMLDRYERHLSEIQANIRVLTAERDKTRMQYQQAQNEIADLRHQLINSRVSHGPKCAVSAQAVLRRLETDRDEAVSDLHRMSTERDSLRERLKISQETAICEKAHLGQRLEELQNTILTLEQERGGQKCRQAQMKDTVIGLEKEMNTLGSKLAAREDDLGLLKNECSLLRMSNTRAENTLSETQRRLTIRIEELQKVLEKNKQLDERNDLLQKELVSLKGEMNSLWHTITELNQHQDALQIQLERKNKELSSTNNVLDEKENTIQTLKLQMKDLETTTEDLANSREYELDIMRRKLLDSGEEMKALLKVKDALQRENIQLRDDLDRVRLDNQALQLKLDGYKQEVMVLERRLQDYVSDVSRLEDLLSSKERECRELQDCRLALQTSDSENRSLKERVDSLETSLQEALSAERRCNAERLQVNRELQQQEKKLQVAHTECSSTQHNLEKTRELCIKLDANKETVQKELDSCRTEMELLRNQLLIERENNLHRQLSSQERLVEIQLLRDKLTVADSKANTQSREMAELRTRSVQFGADLEATRRQLCTEQFERERAVQELRRLGLSSSKNYPTLTSTFCCPPSPIIHSLNPYTSFSPEHTRHIPSDHLPLRRSPDRSGTFKELLD